MVVKGEAEEDGAEYMWGLVVIFIGCIDDCLLNIDNY